MKKKHWLKHYKNNYILLEWILTSFSLAEPTKGIDKTRQLKALNYIPLTSNFMAYNCWLESQISNGLKLDWTLDSCRSYQFTHHILLCSRDILNESTRTCVDLFALPEYHQEYSMDSDHKQKLVHVICSSCVALLSYLY